MYVMHTIGLIITEILQYLSNAYPVFFLGRNSVVGFYRAMHYSAKRGLAIICRLSVRLSVTLVDCDHIG